MVKDYGTPELHKRLGVIKKNGLAYIPNQNIIDVYHNLEKISNDQYQTACNLQYYYSRSGLDLAAKNRYEIKIGKDLDYNHEIPANQFYEIRYITCLRSIPSIKDRFITRKVVCYNEPIKQQEQFQNLRQSLDLIAKFDSKFQITAYL